MGGTRNLLPGGLVTDGRREREFSFERVDGALELAIAEAAESAANVPEAVSMCLLATLRTLAGQEPTYDRIDSLCVPDRQHLMRELSRRVGEDGGWMAATCSSCSARFQFEISYASLPVSEAGAGFPEARVTTNRGTIRLRLPCGADQRALLEVPPEQRTPQLLASFLAANAGDTLPSSLSAQELDAIDRALEEVSPGVVQQVEVACPGCSTVNRVGLDPYAVLRRTADQVLADVHRLASSYHWSETEILALPLARRQQYLRRIDSARGMTE